jgi:hypothetical protein
VEGRVKLHTVSFTGTVTPGAPDHDTVTDPE